MQYTLGENESIDAIQMPLLMPFSEYWTFSRPADAAIRAQLRPECPICGAPIDIDTGRICRYCNTLMPPVVIQRVWSQLAADA